MTKQIAVLIGSASKTSFNHLAVKHLQKIAPSSLQLNIVEIGDLPLYDRDLDEQDIPQYTRVREAVKSADAVIWVSPEHNAGYSAMLKNAIDVCSRPMGQSVWIGKPLAILTVNASGSPRVADSLRTLASAPYINMPTLPFSAVIGGIFAGAFNENGELVSEQAQTTLQNFINAYAEFIARF
ncbi:NADPH-dependent FMN reductase [Moraxella sp. ZY210820]|uniref:NADPH-dependent FMN reductase n=1 Tax=unclassified Moraxella TaxID=2685852 RepID=UPI0027309301|nr:NADPH-dependent FMN reductase [Moraxella sp. ZY210820]WLF84449.1 NAD(P)H-dependent oxidoreductase [Moraxella sp. ZY210820]